VANQYTVVYDSGRRTVPVSSDSTGEVATFPVSPAITVAAGDVIGFYGQGIPFNDAGGADVLSFPAPVAPVLNATMTLGVDAGLPIYPVSRSYSFAAAVAPAIAFGSAVSVGNSLVARENATDGVAGVGQQAPLLVVLPNSTLPAGQLQSFQTWNQVSPLGRSPFRSAGNVFHAYVLHPTGVANQYTVVYDSGRRTVPVSSDSTGEVATFPVSPGVAVAAGDVIGFYGQGIPFNDAGGADVLSFPAPVAPVLNATMRLGVDAGLPIYPVSRSYSFAAAVASTP
jgi:hypothetical protein